MPTGSFVASGHGGIPHLPLGQRWLVPPPGDVLSCNFAAFEVTAVAVDCRTPRRIAESVSFTFARIAHRTAMQKALPFGYGFSSGGNWTVH